MEGMVGGRKTASSPLGARLVVSVERVSGQAPGLQEIFGAR
jgi:hypothetical protein